MVNLQNIFDIISFTVLSTIISVVLWIFNQRFVTKDELKAELKAIEKELHTQDKLISNLSTKMDNVIKSVDTLTSAVNDIKDFLINPKKGVK